MFGMGPMELVVIAGVALLLFGAKRIPEVAKSLGKSLNAFKEGLREVSKDIQDVQTDIKKDSEETKT